MPISSSASVPLGMRARVDLDLVEALIVAGRQGRHVVVRNEERQAEGAVGGGDDAAGIDRIFVDVPVAATAGDVEFGAGGIERTVDRDLRRRQIVRGEQLHRGACADGHRPVVGERLRPTDHDADAAAY